MKSVYSAVRTGALNKAVCAWALEGFVFIWEQTATCATYSINWLVFIIQMKSVYSAVRTGALNKAVCAWALEGFVFIWEQTATCATYSINWLVFITQMKSVYSAVRTGALNTEACASSLNGYDTLLNPYSRVISVQLPSKSMYYKFSYRIGIMKLEVWIHLDFP